MMKYKLCSLLSLMIICLVPYSPRAAFAQTSGPGQKQKPAIYLRSEADASGVKDAELAGIYRDVDASLMDQVRDGLASREIKVNVVHSDQEMAADPTRYILLIRLDRVELGGKRPFGRTAKVRVVYTLENKDRFALVKRTDEETSVQRWQNCVKKIGEQIVADVNSDLAKRSVPDKADDKQAKTKSAPAGSASEARLQELENLRTKGLITEQEYETKRKEILKEL